MMRYNLLTRKSSWILPPCFMVFRSPRWNLSGEAVVDHHLALANLQRRFLAHVDKAGNIWMHKILRNMGYSISCPAKSGVDKWKRMSRSSFAKELITKHQGDVDAQAVKLEVRKNEILILRNNTFANYANLEYLMLEGVRMSSGTVELPPSLVYLRWKNGLFTSCPVDFGRLRKLVVLELVDCKSMKCLPPSVVNAIKLLWLELEGCLLLTELPLGLSRDLEYLSFNRTSIQTLPSDLWKFKGLKQLHAKETVDTSSWRITTFGNVIVA